MAKKFKLKYLIIAFIIIMIITASTAFSVSYASWVGTNKTLTANTGIGLWNKVSDVKDIDWGDVKEGIYFNGKVINLSDKFAHGNQVWLDPEPGDEAFFKLNGELISSNNSKFSHHEVLGVAYWFHDHTDHLNEPVVVEKVENGITYKVEYIPATGSFKFLSGDKFNIYYNEGYLSIVAGHGEISDASKGEVINKDT